MIFVTDAGGQCVYASPEWEALTGQPSKDALRSGWEVASLAIPGSDLSIHVDKEQWHAAP